MDFDNIDSSTQSNQNFITYFESTTKTSWDLLVRNAKDGGANSVLASYILDKSRTILHQGDETVSEMLNSVVQIENKLTELETFSTRIHSLSEQAKFLSLNAFIEASRAGIHGKTFGVVADELGQLTREVKNLTIKIDGLLHEVSESVVNNRRQCDSVAEIFTAVNGELQEFNQLMKKIEQLSVNQSHILESVK